MPLWVRRDGEDVVCALVDKQRPCDVAIGRVAGVVRTGSSDSRFAVAVEAVG